MIGKTRKYPWEIWLNGQSHTIYKGRDYIISSYKFVNQIYMAARRREVSVSVSIIDEGAAIRLQAVRIVKNETRSFTDIYNKPIQKREWL